MSLAATATSLAYQQCIMPDCGASYGVEEVRTSCDACGALLDIQYDWDRLEVPDSLRWFEQKWSRRNDPLCRSGVWRFHELLPFAPPEKVVTVGEGQTPLVRTDGVGEYIGMRPGQLLLEYEGMNPSGSFKDNGMTAAFTHAHQVGASRAACASTGNTSASLALYCCSSKLM
ncbi:MAG: pyridoxal-phosphate dependent enzyme, partial [Planctomycetales bacterium]|nr:pyridoxal-phosphate dependent enzyme [Planctomycetales bacterium]